VLLMIPGQAPADEDVESNEIEALIQKFDSFLEARQLDRALPIGEQAREKTKNKYGKSHLAVTRILYKLGKCYFFDSNYDRCEFLWKEALNIREKVLGPKHPNLVEISNGLASLYLRQGQYSKAEVMFKEGLNIREAALGPDHPQVALILHNLALLYSNQSRLDEAESFQRRALAIKEKALIEKHPDVTASHVAISQDKMATIYKRQGKYREAEPLYKRALAVFEEIHGPNHHLVAKSLNNLANLYWEQGKLAEAEPLHKRALDITEKIYGPDHYKFAVSLNNLANLYWDQGKITEAEPLYKRALDIYEKTLGSKHPDIALILFNLANRYRDEGKYHEAEPLYRRAIDIQEEVLGPDNPDLAWTLTGLAVFYQNQGRYGKAEPLHKRALAIREKALGKNHPTVAVSLSNLEKLYQAQGKYRSAAPLCRRALAIREKAVGPDLPATAESLESLAILCSSLGNFGESLSCFRKLQRSRQHFIEYAFSYASEDQKMRYIREYPLIHHPFLSFAVMINRGVPEGSSPAMSAEAGEVLNHAALEMTLKAKAAVIDAISAEREIAYHSYDKDIRKKTERHTGICGEIATLTLAGLEKNDPTFHLDRLKVLYQEKDDLETELSGRCAAFEDKLSAKRFTVAEVAEAMPRGSVLWEIVRYQPYNFKKKGSDEERTGPPRYLAFTLDPEMRITLTDLGDAGEIDRLIHSARERIYQSRTEVYSRKVVESERRLNEVTRKLYQIIFKPLASRLGKRKDIFISPDGQLNLLPFEIFPCPDGQYVIEKYRISYLSSGRDLLGFRKKRETGDWALVMADPDFNLSSTAMTRRRDPVLDHPSASPVSQTAQRGVSGCFDHRFESLRYSRKEAEAVTAALRTGARIKTTTCCGGDALEDFLKRMPDAPKVLHLATHGFFCGKEEIAGRVGLENPLLRCGLALAGANHPADAAAGDASPGEDGILTAFEVSGLDLVGTELVILSACETDVGEVKNGEGVLGLRRSFQHAGADSIIMSLWKVPEKETSELMKQFYRN